MIKSTSNIKIISNLGDMTYLVDYNESYKYVDAKDIILCDELSSDDPRLDFKINNINDITAIRRHGSYWSKFDCNNISNILLPKHINLSYINLYFPEFSVDTYELGIKYALTINTWINGKCIYLGSYLIDRLDALALSPIKNILNNTYYEYISVPILNPYDIIYSDEWKLFRENICGSSVINNEGSILNISLYPVSYNIDNNIYILLDHYTGSINSLKLLKLNTENNLKLDLNFYSDGIGPCFENKILFNDNFKDLKTYLYKTYNMTDIDLVSYKLIVLNKLYINNEEDIIRIIIRDYDIVDDIPIINKYYKSNKIGSGELSFWDWSEWSPGMYITSYITIHGMVGKQSYDLNLKSNAIPFTLNLVKYFIYDKDLNFLKKINLELMKIININAVNKILNNIIQMDQPEDSKSNITYPVFYRSTEINNIIIHPEVTENICINLDVYKSKVSTFSIKIEGIIFTEIGRTSAGIIFKVMGNRLPGKMSTGLYYILNENNELVTSGNYKYIK